MVGVQRTGHLGPDGDDPRLRQRSLAQKLSQIRAVDVLHREVRNLADPVEVVQRGDSGVAERRDDAGLALEPAEPLLVEGELLGKQLQSDDATEARVLRPIDLPHAALSDAREDPVVAENPTFFHEAAPSGTAGPFLDSRIGSVARIAHRIVAFVHSTRLVIVSLHRPEDFEQFQ